MFDLDPYMKAGLVSFFIPVILGCMAYWLASVLASLLSTSPQRRYHFRLLILAAFVVAITFFFGIPNFVSTGHPNHVRMLYVREVGGKYGTMSVYMWLIFAILKRPKDDTAD